MKQNLKIFRRNSRTIKADAVPDMHSLECGNCNSTLASCSVFALSRKSPQHKHKASESVVERTRVKNLLSQFSPVYNARLSVLRNCVFLLVSIQLDVSAPIVLRVQQPLCRLQTDISSFLLLFFSFFFLCLLCSVCTLSHDSGHICMERDTHVSGLLAQKSRPERRRVEKIKLI